MIAARKRVGARNPHRDATMIRFMLYCLTALSTAS